MLLSAEGKSQVSGCESGIGKLQHGLRPVRIKSDTYSAIEALDNRSVVAAQGYLGDKD